MIFVTVGTQLPFDRLVKAVDDWAEVSDERDIIAQVGPADYAPRHFPTFPFVEPPEFARLLRECSVIVAHAGIGSIATARNLGKPIIVLPRDHLRGEHRDGHQIATAAEFAGRPGIYIAADEAEVGVLLNMRGMLKAGPLDDGRAPIEMVERLNAWLTNPPPMTWKARLKRLVFG